MRRWWGRALAVVVGAGPALAFPAAGLGWLAFVALVPVLLAVAAAPSRREASWRAGLSGAGFFVAVHHWLLPSVSVFAVPLALALGALWVPWGLLAWRLLGGPATAGRLLASLVLLPSAWVAAELARSWEHLGGPWALLGTSQWAYRPVLELAAVGGVWLVSFVLVCVNVAVAVAASRDTTPRLRVAAVLVAGGIVAATLAHGGWRSSPRTPGVAVVAGVQTGVVHGAGERVRAHELATAGIAGSRPDLVVWGESSVGFDLTTRPRHLGRIAGLARAVGADVLVNVDARRGSGGIFKTSLLVGPNGPRGRYDKARLVPFGEYIPLRSMLGWVGSVTDAAVEDRRRGSDPAVLHSGRLRLGPLVCFESAFPDLARQLVRSGADVVVVQSATTTFQGSWAQPQHASLAAVRAVESGRSVVHVSVSGVSAVFDPSGRRLAWLGADRVGTMVTPVPVATGTTPYVRYGDWVPYGSLAVLAAAGLAWSLRRLTSRRRGRRVRLGGPVADQLREQPGHHQHAEQAGQTAGHDREAGPGQGGHRSRLGVPEAGTTGDHGDVGGREAAPQGVGDVELQDGVTEHR